MPVQYFRHDVGALHPSPYRQYLQQPYDGRTLVISQAKVIIHSLKDEFPEAFIIDGPRAIRDYSYAQRPEMVLATAHEFKQPKAKPIEQQTFSRTVFVHSPAVIDPSTHLSKLVDRYYTYKTEGHELICFVDPLWLFKKPALIWGMARLADFKLNGRPFPRLRDWLNSVSVGKMIRTRNGGEAVQWSPVTDSRRDYVQQILESFFGEQLAHPSNETSFSPTQPSGDL